MTSGQFDAKTEKLQWYWAPVFCAACFLLFYVAVLPSYYYYPEMLRISDEHQHPEQFIGERARMQLKGLASIGIKYTGTVEHEVALNYLLQEIEKIKAAARLDLYDIDVQVQHSSGEFKLWTMAIGYRNVTNIVVKIAPKHTVSSSYLLVNSHYDSAVGSPGAADAGVMIVTMLETLRVISSSEKELKNPIVFLLNGAEENGLLGSHAFITQHEWAPFCRALINLDSAGSGGREVVFQSGPGHPWLLKYYKQSVPHPLVSTIAEELFQHNFIPSDTDFRIFRDYGAVPGLDMAHTLNGYVYHTKYDTFRNVEPGTYQITGDNILGLTRALANAAELSTASANSKGNAVFYDVLGWFTISYSEATGEVVNIVISVCALLAIAASVYNMTHQRKTAEAPKKVYLRFCFIFLVQMLTLLIATGVTIMMAVIVEASGLSLSWYSAEWITFGLYYCPMFFVMGLIPASFIHWNKKDAMRLNDTICCFMHAHCLILVFLCLLMTSLNIRSAYFVMFAIYFYAISVIFKLATDLFCKKCYFLPIHLLSQLLPYWFYTYHSFASLKIFVPMQGRDGPTSKPELVIAGFSIIMSVLFGGFLLPVLHKFRKSKTIFSIFGVLTVVFFIIAATPVGFPFKPEVAVQRFYVLHTNRIIYDQFNRVHSRESGFYIQPVDPRHNTLDDTTFKNAVPQAWIDKACAEEVFCGLPLYSSRWMKWKNSTRWIPASPPQLETATTLKLNSKQFITNSTHRFSFSLLSTDRVVIYIDPLAKNRVVNWSFDRTLLEQSYKAPYFISHVDSMIREPLEFWLEIERESSSYEGPSMRLAVGAHFQHHTHMYTQEFNEFLQRFPNWAYPTTGVASFESWYF